MGGIMTHQVVLPVASADQYRQYELYPQFAKLRKAEGAIETVRDRESSFSLSSLLPTRKDSALRRRPSHRRDFDRYAFILIRNFQGIERLHTEKMRRSYAEFLTRFWLSKKVTTNPPVVKSSAMTLMDALLGTPTASRRNSSPAREMSGPDSLDPRFATFAIHALNLRNEFDNMVMELIQKKLPIPTDACEAIFADYIVTLTVRDAQSKIMALTQLKIREAAAATVSRPAKDKSFTNPLVSTELVHDFLLLAFWPIFEEYERLYQASSQRALRTETFFSKRHSTPAGSVSVKKESSPVVPFEDSECDRGREDITQPRRFADFTLQGDSFRGSDKTQNLTESTKICDPGPLFPSWSSSSITPPININRKPSKLDLDRHQSLLGFLEFISTQAQKDSDFSSNVKSGTWWHSSIFFNHLEHTNIAISIHAVEKDATQFPIIFVNQTWEMLTGHFREDVIGQEMRLLRTRTTEQNQLDRLEFVMKQGYGLKIGLNLQRRGGIPFFTLLSVLPVYDSKNQYKYIVIKLYDVQNTNATVTGLRYSEEVMYLIALALRCL